LNIRFGKDRSPFSDKGTVAIVFYYKVIGTAVVIFPVKETDIQVVLFQRGGDLPAGGPVADAESAACDAQKPKVDGNMGTLAAYRLPGIPNAVGNVPFKGIEKKDFVNGGIQRHGIDHSPSASF
jgi:hypothetical protein